VNIEDILLYRDVIFGDNELTPQGLANLSLTDNNNVDIYSIMLVRDVIFGI